jgi:cytochrome c oxidase subunit 1
MFTREEQLSGAYLGVAIGALAIGMLLGLLQALEHAGIDLYPLLKPLIYSYYQGLTIHGVLNVLIWTTFFICGFLLFTTVRALQQPLASIPLGTATFWLMVIGLGLTLWSMLSNDATVLFTFYPPMRAHPAFYLGLTLIVVGTWLVTANLVLTYRAWRRAHPTARTPLAAFGALITFVMWTIASLGIAAEMLFLNIPWSLGVLPETNALLARTLFWFTGHPIVYFWLLPAYVSWYTMVPRQAGGKLFSDPMARVAFVLFLVLSTPVGIHHQFTDPGISPNWKLVHAFITFALFFPSLLTFFNVTASLEYAGRARGGRGWLAWIWHLPWQDPALVAQLLAMVLFAFGGISGLVNASLEVNLAVHNTAWVVGHFHLTVGAAVTLTFMGISYWLVPLLAGRRLWSPRLALVQAWLWFGGMALFAPVLHRLGLLDMPRRTAIGAAPYVLPEWQPFLPWIGVGGAVLFLSGVLYLLNLLLTVSVAPRERPGAVPFAEAVTGPEHAPAILDRWRPWLAFAAVLILVAYGPTLAHLLAATPFNVPARRVW